MSVSGPGRPAFMRHFAIVGLVGVALLSAMTGSVTAQPKAASVEEERPIAYPKPRIVAPRPVGHAEVQQWYGLPLAAVGVGSVVLTLVGGAAGSEQAVMLGITTGVTSGLLFHMLISPVDQLGWGIAKGLLSVGLRFGLGLTACLVGSGCGELTTAAVTRLSLGMLAGVVLDAWLLSTRTVDAPRRSMAWQNAPVAGCEGLATGISCRW